MSRVIRDLLETALRMQRFPGIIFIEGPAGRRAHLAGTGLDVWEVIQLLREYGAASKLREHFPRLSPMAIQIAEGYAKAYPNEIGAFLASNTRTAEELRRGLPWLETVRSQVPVGILLDADVPPAVAGALNKLGNDALAASGNPTLEALNDIELLREASRQGRALVTFNIADFSEAARMLAHAQEDHAGIILIHSKSFPRTDIGAIARALDALLRSRQTFVNSVLYLR